MQHDLLCNTAVMHNNCTTTYSSLLLLLLYPTQYALLLYTITSKVSLTLYRGV